MPTFLEQMQGDDLDIYFDVTAGFAVTAIYTSGRDGVKEIPVIFDSDVVALDPYGEDDTNTKPQALAKTTDVPKNRHQDTIEIDNVVYDILKAVSDDSGITTLTLLKTRDDS